MVPLNKHNISAAMGNHVHQKPASVHIVARAIRSREMTVKGIATESKTRKNRVVLSHSRIISDDHVRGDTHE